MIPQKNRLSRSQVASVIKKGKRLSSEHFNIKYLARTSKNHATRQESRFCVVVSTKISPKATERNRIRRQIFEAIAAEQTKIPLDIILFTKPSIKDLDFGRIKEEFAKILHKIASISTQQ
ncbi:ribonuclease P protein component [Patescibacteria group bacterium]|nr:ribonuclease P protein component [Patescibacteria group bacterium]MBU1703186.1 ribonuclease P protein component [Patescibacteria group bacterium]MBU1953530.1 ribonuclease P protein component [Patescibacteria group bacterium]